MDLSIPVKISVSVSGYENLEEKITKVWCNKKELSWQEQDNVQFHSIWICQAGFFLSLSLSQPANSSKPRLVEVRIFVFSFFSKFENHKNKRKKEIPTVVLFYCPVLLECCSCINSQDSKLHAWLHYLTASTLLTCWPKFQSPKTSWRRKGSTCLILNVASSPRCQNQWFRYRYTSHLLPANFWGQVLVTLKSCAAFVALAWIFFQDTFWWFFLEKYQPTLSQSQVKLFSRSAHNYVQLLSHATQSRYRETFLKVGNSLFACLFYKPRITKSFYVTLLGRFSKQKTLFHWTPFCRNFPT